MANFNHCYPVCLLESSYGLNTTFDRTFLNFCKCFVFSFIFISNNQEEDDDNDDVRVFVQFEAVFNPWSASWSQAFCFNWSGDLLFINIKTMYFIRNRKSV